LLFVALVKNNLPILLLLKVIVLFSFYLKQQIETTDKEIDTMVYELYGLSEEEIKIVENS
jgi:hypothetical protein